MNHLDISIKMTNTECRSKLIADVNKKVMNIKVFQASGPSCVYNTLEKLCEFISRLFAKENNPWIIKEES